MTPNTKKYIMYGAGALAAAIILYRIALEVKIQMEITTMKRYIKDKATREGETDQDKVNSVLQAVSKIVRNNHSGWKW